MRPDDPPLRVPAAVHRGGRRRLGAFFEGAALGGRAGTADSCIASRATTWEISAASSWTPAFPLDYDPAAVAREVLDQAINDTLGADPDISVQRVVREGLPVPLLLAEARGADLLVVGTHGHGALAGILVNSVAEHLLRHAPCAVVIVRCDRAAS